MQDVRYSELLFLQAVAAGKIDYFNVNDHVRQKALELPQQGDFYVEMAIAALEDLSIRFDNPSAQRLVARLRREFDGPSVDEASGIGLSHSKDPRWGLFNILTINNLQRIRITFRGLQRIEELRDLLRRDRILDHLGVVLDMRYFRRDLQDAINRSSDLAVSVIYADMDDFGQINKKFGQAAGDVVMKAYLEVVRDCVGQLGSAYRGVGDEVAALVIGQGHESAAEIAKAIKNGVEALHCDYKGAKLPTVTASVGVATTPPEDRAMEIEMLAEERKRKAKDKGKNQVVAK